MEVPRAQFRMTSFQAFVSNIFRALSLIWRCSRTLTVAGIALVLIQSLLPLAGLYLMKTVVDALTVHQPISFRRVAFLIALSAAIALLDILCTSIAGIIRESQAKEIRLFNLGSIFVERFRGLREQLGMERLDLLRRRLISEGTADAVTTVTAFAAYAVTAYQTIQGIITVGDLVMFYQAIQRARAYVHQLLSSMASLYENNLFLSNVYEFLDLKPKVTEP